MKKNPDSGGSTLQLRLDDIIHPVSCRFFLDLLVSVDAQKALPLIGMLQKKNN